MLLPYDGKEGSAPDQLRRGEAKAVPALRTYSMLSRPGSQFATRRSMGAGYML
jgi:hypothetical protein